MYTMDFEKLPFEILTQIGSHLTSREMEICTRVCRKWYRQFITLLLSSVVIEDSHQLKAFTWSLTFSERKIRLFAPIVDSLHLKIHNDVSPKLIRWMQKYLRGMERLDIENGSLSKGCFGASSNWKSWRRLTHLKLCLSDCSIYKKELIESLAGVPTLVYLNLSQGGVQPKFSCEFEYIEAIHSCLPMLEKLVLSHTFKSLTKIELDKALDVTKAKKMRCVVFETNMMDLGWVYYWGCKYPNLTTIECLSGFDCDKTDRYHDQRLETRPHVKTFFKNLRLVKLRADIEKPKFQVAFVKLIARSSANLASFTYAPIPFVKIAMNSISAISNGMKALKDIPAFVLFLQKETKWPGFLLKGVNHFSLIKELVIKSQATTVSLHDILNYCSSLKVLEICGANIAHFKVDESSWKPHCLEKLKMVHCTVQIQSLAYLSARCKNLCELRLLFVKVQAPLNPEEYHIEIDMGNTQLRKLLIHQVEFERLDKKDDATKESIHYLIISQSGQRPSAKKRESRSGTSVRENTVSTRSNTSERFPASNTWLYVNAKRFDPRIQGGSLILKSPVLYSAVNYLEALRTGKKHPGIFYNIDMPVYARHRPILENVNFPRCFMRWRFAYIANLYNGLTSDHNYPQSNEYNL